MKDTNSTIKKKQLTFSLQDTTFIVHIKYDTKQFGDGARPSFWEIQLSRVNEERLLIPLTYHFTQSRGWLQQIPKFRVHRYICSTRRKEIENTTNLYPLVKEQIAYQWFNRKKIFRYEAQINNFNFLVEQKYNKKLAPSREQRAELKQKLKLGKIDKKQYQKLYTPIRKKIDEIEHRVWNICYNYKRRYFDGDRLKQIYRVD